MAKLITDDLTNLNNPTSAVATINENFARVELAMENTLSRNGTTPNTMGASLDLNSNKIINVSEPTSDGDVATKKYVDDLVEAVEDIVPLGGTATQLLAKASSTDYDTVWVNRPAEPLTTKGDLYGFSTVPARVPAGSTGLVLTSNPDISTGLAYLPCYVGPNLLINGDLQINQRKSVNGAVANGVYWMDRWKANGASNFSITGYDVTITSGSLFQVIETAWVGGKSFANLPITVSVEEPSADITVALGSASGIITAGSGRRSVTLIPTTDAGTLNLTLTPVSGSVTFRRVCAHEGVITYPWVNPNRTDETARCQRYYVSAFNMFAGFAAACPILAQTTTRYFGEYTLPVPMRTAPTVSSTTLIISNINATIGNVSSCIFYGSSSNHRSITLDITSSGAGVVGSMYFLAFSSATTSHVSFSAEL